MNQTPAFLTHLQKTHLAAKESFAKKHVQAAKFFEDKKIDLGQIRQHSSRLLTAGTLAGTMLLGAPNLPSLPKPVLTHKLVAKLTSAGVALPQNPKSFLAVELKNFLPPSIIPLGQEQEREIAFFIEKLTGIKTRANLEGEKLNTIYGLIGAEQHLPRFPGDQVSAHDALKNAGITPGLGAWGYFTSGRQNLSPGDILREKYYVAVQTFIVPDFNKRFAYLRDWYKYRKVMVINPQNGQAVVAVVADAGPATWTGKHFGGSPEVMETLGLYRGPRKGPVLLFFVDDPENKVPLGPVDYKINLPMVKEKEV